MVGVHVAVSHFAVFRLSFLTLTLTAKWETATRRNGEVGRHLRV